MEIKIISVQSRIGHTMTNVGDKVYICFGFNKNEYFSDIWEYDGNRWKVIVLSIKIEIAFHSTVCYDNKLVVFGGKMNMDTLIHYILLILLLVMLKLAMILKIFLIVVQIILLLF